MGTPALHQAGHGDGVTFSANTDRNTNVGHTSGYENSVFTFQGSTRFATAGILSNLWVRCIVNTRDGTADYQVRIHATSVDSTGTLGNGLVEVPALTTGAFEDTVNTEVVPAGSAITGKIFSRHSSGGGIFETSIHASLFTSNVDEKVYRVTGHLGSGYGDGVMSLMSDSTDVASGEESDTQVTGHAGTYRNAGIHAHIHSGGTGALLVLRVDEADTLLSISIPGGTTGYFEDLVHQVTVTEDSRVNWRTAEGGATLGNQSISVDFVTTGFFGGGSVQTAGVALTGSVGSGAAVDNIGLTSGYHKRVALTDEATMQGPVLETGSVWTGLTFFVRSNGQNGPVVFTGRKNGSPTGFSATVPATTTGRFTTTGPTVSLDAGDLLTIRRLTNGTNSSAFNYVVHNFLGAGALPPGPAPVPVPSPLVAGAGTSCPTSDPSVASVGSVCPVPRG